MDDLERPMGFMTHQVEDVGWARICVPSLHPRPGSQ